MVRLKAPLFSLEASGTLGKSVVFAKWKGRDYARRHAIPANPKSGLQTGIRAVFGFCAAHWQIMNVAYSATWEIIAANRDLTGLNAYIADAVDLARRNRGWRDNAYGQADGTVNAPTNGVATAQPNTLVVTWSAPVANPPDLCYAIYASTETGFTPDISNLVGVIDASTLQFTHRGLTSGVEMFYRIRGLDVDGTLGSLLAQFSGTPL